MRKKPFYVLLQIAIGTAVFGLMINLTTAMASSSTSQGISKEADPGLTNSVINQVDPYVKVINGQYKLETPISALSKEQIASVQEAIHQANLLVLRDDRVIDDKTKVAMGSLQMMRGRPSKETRDYWWGRRTIFRSNSSIYREIHSIETGATLFAIGAIWWSPSAVGAAYMGKLASDLNYNQNIHSRSKIYMDINKSFIYTIGVWHD